MRLPPPGPRRDLCLALLLALVAAVFRFPGLHFPAKEYFDEVYHAVSARQYLEGVMPVEWVHPPTAKHLISIGVALFGYSAWAWRLAPALAGTLLAPVFFLLARRVLPTERAALLASVLLLSDGVYLVQSRVAMTNIFAVLFQCAAMLMVLRAGPGERLRGLDMSLLGLALGLALSTRWTSLMAMGFCGLVFLVLRGRRLLRPREAALLAYAFVALPLAVYATSYLPLVTGGHLHVSGSTPNPLASMADLERGARDLWQEQTNVWGYHAGLQAEHPYFSKWYTWPFLYRPTWYFYEQHGGRVHGIVALGNPALWWASLPITLWALATGLRARDPRALFAGLGFLFLYLPWGLSPRTLNYNHYLFEAIPYACLALGLLLDRHWDGRFRNLARGYVAAVVLLFFHFLPLFTALGFPLRWFYWSAFPDGTGRLWTWFRTWI
jgi:dolichyl-phosphate-mannose--protein O-mannosyl transferase